MMISSYRRSQIKNTKVSLLETIENGDQMNEQTTARVLLVDDEEDFLKMLSERLKLRGLQVNTSISGEGALDKVQEQAFDAIILDLSMPGMDGIETLKGIKKAHPDAEIIILTGHGSIKSGITAMKEGACDFLEKPVSMEQLLGKIDEAKSRRLLVLQKQSQQELQQLLKSRGW